MSAAGDLAELLSRPWVTYPPVDAACRAYADLWREPGGPMDPRSLAQGHLEGMGMLLAALTTDALVADTGGPGALLRLLDTDVRPVLAARIAEIRESLPPLVDLHKQPRGRTQGSDDG